MYKLYNVKTWGSLAPHLVLEELGVPYQNIWMTPDQVRSAEFREISPLGQIPALGLPDGRAAFESVGIVAFLTTAHAEKRLAPPIGTPDHAIYLSWLAFLGVNLYEAISLAFGGQRLADTPEQAAIVQRRSIERTNQLFDMVEERLVAEGPFMLGAQFSALDIYLFMLALWGRPTEESLLARCPGIARVAAAVRARPRLKAALETHGVMKPGGYNFGG